MSRYEPDPIEILEKIAVDAEAISFFFDGMECAGAEKIYNVRRKLEGIENMLRHVANGIERMKEKEEKE